MWSDLHLPSEDKKAVELVCKFISDFKPHHQVIIGDLMDLAGIGKWNEKRFISQYQNQIADDFDCGNKMLDRIQSLSPKSKTYYLEGNHEWRSSEYGERHPAFEKFVSVRRNLNLAKRGIPYYSYPNQKFYPLKIGKLGFIHGSYTGKHAAAKIAEEAGIPIAFGHIHSFQSFTKKEFGKHNKKMAWSVGHLSREDLQKWLKTGSSWITGFAYFYVLPNGHFSFYQVPIISNAFIVEGQLYE